MTRNQLIEKRKQKKRRQLIQRIGAGGGVLVLLLLLIFVIIPRIGKGKSKENEVPEAVKVSTDTASKTAVDAGKSGIDGWNLDDTGWWYKNDDNTMYTSGWKTVDGQRYYFKDDGYMATGWVNTGNVRDDYFDESGILDPSKKQKLIALTFDDGPSKNTDTILDVLEQYDAKATFFVVGMQAEYYTDQLKREQSMGMEIGSHTYEHTTLKYQDADTIRNAMDKNDETINKLIGITPEIMRPTGGGVDETVANNIFKPMINWDVDTLDWDTKDADNTFDVATTTSKEGSIILMHDLYEATAEAVKMIVPELKKQGYKMVTISELAEAYGYTLEPGGLYFDFYPTPSGDNKTSAELKAATAEGYNF